MGVIVLLISATVLYTLFGLFVAKAGGKLNDNLSAGIFNSIGTIIPLLSYLFIRSKNSVVNTKAGIIYSILAGISIAAFSVILVSLFAKAENVSFIMPAIYGGVVVLGTIAGIFVFKESLASISMLGICLTIIGIGLVVYGRLTT